LDQRTLFVGMKHSLSTKSKVNKWKHKTYSGNKLFYSSSRPAPGKTTPSPSMEKERMLALFRNTAEG